MSFFGNAWLITVSIILTVFTSTAMDFSSAQGRTYDEREWGLGMVMRGATIPFNTDETRVTSLVPMMWYQGERVYFLGTEGGLILFEDGAWRLSAAGRLHFFDIPSSLQNDYQGDTVDFGLQVRRNIIGPTYIDFEIMTDFEGNGFFNFRYASSWKSRRFQFYPYFEIKLKSDSYNSYYFGLDRASLAGGADFSVGFVGTYHFVSNLYAYGAAKATLLDGKVRDSEFVSKDGLGEFYLGIGLSNDRNKPLRKSLPNSAYWRVAQGWATPSSLADIFNGEAKKDEFNNKMTSVFYGRPLTDKLFGLPIPLYVSGGLVWHWKSSVQKQAQEFVANIKLYYTVPLPVRLRLGAAEGVSYVNTIPYVEESQLTKKGYNTSNLLNFLDFSADISMGDIFGGEAMRHWWLGYGIHHRSAIFESVQHFGRIKGGSNFQTVYLQWHY